MIKQVIHIIVFSALTILLLTTIAKSQDTSPYAHNSEGEANQSQVHEEVMEYVYKFDLPAEEKSIEIEFQELPLTVRKGFQDSDHASWDIMQVYKVEQDQTSMFMLLVEHRGYIETLHYNYWGDLIAE